MTSFSARGTMNNGLDCLVDLLRFHGMAADVSQLRHAYGITDAVDLNDLIRIARGSGLKARAIRRRPEQLKGLPLPAIVSVKNGHYLLLGKVMDDKLLVLEPGTAVPVLMPRAEFEANWDGGVILAAKRATLGDVARRFDIGWFVAAMHKYRWLLGEVLLASFFLQVFALITPLFFQVIIDKVLVHRGVSTLEVLIIGLVTVAIFETVLSALRTHIFADTTNRIDVELGARLFRHLLALPLNYFQSRRVGDSVARVRELENIRTFITSSALTVVIDILFTGVFIGVMLIYSVWLTVLVLLSLPLYVGISVWATPLFRRRLDEKFKRGAENQSFLVEAVTGVETLKAMAVEPQLQRRWEEQLAGYVGASFRVTRLSNIASQAFQMVNKVTTAGILYFGALAVIDGDMTVGALVAFNMLASRVSQPVLRLAQLWQDFHQARLSIDRLGDILNTPTEPQSRPGQVSLRTIQGDVAFERVRFRYQLDGPAVLSGINLHVQAGEVIGIVGASGSGKSTLTKLIQRLYVPEAGRVLIDGTDIALIDASSLRRQIGVVLQDNVLMRATIRENIAVADPGMPLERVIRSAKLAGAHEFILELPEGYETVVGERGSTLSGGQRQRIAIARALVGEPRILIFDEATSSLDYDSERVIQQNLKHIVSGRTVFIVAHRLSAVSQCTRIITLDHGALVEAGSHEELLRAGGRYASLWRTQGGLYEVG